MINQCTIPYARSLSENNWSTPDKPFEQKDKPIGRILMIPFIPD
jgi:hypothetical protein